MWCVGVCVCGVCVCVGVEYSGIQNRTLIKLSFRGTLGPVITRHRFLLPLPITGMNLERGEMYNGKIWLVLYLANEPFER